jgi:hypothetical protein
LYFYRFCLKQVEDEIRRAEQGEIKDGGKHIFRLAKIDFLQYLHYTSFN